MLEDWQRALIRATDKTRARKAAKAAIRYAKKHPTLTHRDKPAQGRAIRHVLKSPTVLAVDHLARMTEDPTTPPGLKAQAARTLLIMASFPDE